MKKTRQLIFIEGERMVVRKALQIIKGFRAITVITEEISKEKIEEIFSNNKNCVTDKRNI